MCICSNSHVIYVHIVPVFSVFRGCTKAYHPKCVGKRNSVLKSEGRWICCKSLNLIDGSEHKYNPKVSPINKLLTYPVFSADIYFIVMKLFSIVQCKGSFLPFVQQLFDVPVMQCSCVLNSF